MISGEVRCNYGFAGPVLVEPVGGPHGLGPSPPKLHGRQSNPGERYALTVNFVRPYPGQSPLQATLLVVCSTAQQVLCENRQRGSLAMFTSPFS
jgi:hypothetical protein